MRTIVMRGKGERTERHTAGEKLLTQIAAACPERIKVKIRQRLWGSEDATAEDRFLRIKERIEKLRASWWEANGAVQQSGRGSRKAQQAFLELACVKGTMVERVFDALDADHAASSKFVRQQRKKSERHLPEGEELYRLGLHVWNARFATVPMHVSRTERRHRAVECGGASHALAAAALSGVPDQTSGATSSLAVLPSQRAPFDPGDDGGMEHGTSDAQHDEDDARGAAAWVSRDVSDLEREHSAYSSDGFDGERPMLTPIARAASESGE